MTSYHKYNTRNISFPKPYMSYAYTRITVSGGTSDISLKDETDLFENIHIANEILISVSGGNVWFKINKQENDAVLLENYWTWNITNMSIQDIYFTNYSAVDIELGIFTLGWQ